MTRTLVLASLLFVGCSTQPAASRSISGQLSTALLGELDNPAIVLRTTDGDQRVVHVTPAGAFKLNAPIGKTAHLAVASTTATGALREDSTIRWPGAWVRVEAGRPIELGVVRLRGGSTAHLELEHDGGVSDDDEADEDEACGGAAEADLPYDAKIPLGASYKLSDSFLEKGPLPAAIVSVTMEGGGAWRLAELQADTTFTVTQADCDHPGNRDTGRDRVIVSWLNADGSMESDHLDLRYCDGSTPPSANAVGSSTASSGECSSTEVCEDDEANDDSECDSEGNSGLVEVDGGEAAGSCPATPAPVPPTGTGPVGAACTTSADCSAPLACFQSTCQTQIN